jgi:TRIAD3 protein (E3 ubiquitin-protein ligase RNF216)
MIKVSDQVKQAEDARKGRAQAQAQAFPYHVVNNRLQHRHPGARPDPIPPPLEPLVRQRFQVNPLNPAIPVPAAQYVPFDPFPFAQVPFLMYPAYPALQYVYFYIAKFAVFAHSPDRQICFHFHHFLSYMQSHTRITKDSHT